MPDCSQCNRPLGRTRPRCHRCGACSECCRCQEGADTEGFDADSAVFDRDELGIDPEVDAAEAETPAPPRRPRRK